LCQGGGGEETFNDTSNAVELLSRGRRVTQVATSTKGRQLLGIDGDLLGGCVSCVHGAGPKLSLTAGENLAGVTSTASGIGARAGQPRGLGEMEGC